jgi:hypothetical protein
MRIVKIMADIRKLNMKSDEFEKHMLTKCENWIPSELCLGHDFAVFIFDTSVDRDNAFNMTELMTKYHNYHVEKDTTFRIVVVNLGDKEQ